MAAYLEAVVWDRIQNHAGEAFALVSGLPLGYRVHGAYVVPDRTRYQIPKSHFIRALRELPLKGPGQIQHLRGPSYIYAILMDHRIRRGDW